MTTFTYQPDYSASKTMKPKVDKIQFGDGYSERYSSGLNTKLESWSVTFKRSPSTVIAIDNFLTARGAVEAFNWTTPLGRAATFVCEEWSVSYDSPGWSTLQATFNEVPEVVSP